MGYIKCSECKRSVYKRPCVLLKFKKFYCSRKCHQKGQKTNKPLKCVTCKKSFYVSISQQKLRSRKNCSKKCYNKLQGKRLRMDAKKTGALTEFNTRNLRIKKLTGSLKTQTAYIKKLDKIFSVFIRQRDSNSNGYVTCITCGGVYHWMEVDCGHYVPRNHKNTRFDEQNCHGQCRRCNRFQNGNMDVYSLKMIEKYGKNILNEMQKRKNIIKQWSVSELEERIEYYKSKVKTAN